MDVDGYIIKGILIGFSSGLVMGWIVCWLNLYSSNSPHHPSDKE
jgi:hypothetical protein